MLVIEVQKHDPAPGMEFTVTSYPRNGAYMLPDGRLMVLAAGCVYSIPSATHMVRPVEDFVASTEAKAPAATGISESFVLKALAIAQNPQLATTLIGGE